MPRKRNKKTPLNLIPSRPQLKNQAIERQGPQVLPDESGLPRNKTVVKFAILAWALIIGGWLMLFKVGMIGFPDRMGWFLACYGVGLICILTGFAWLPKPAPGSKDPTGIGRILLLGLLIYLFRSGWAVFFKTSPWLIALATVLWIWFASPGQPSEEAAAEKQPGWAVWLMIALLLVGAWLRLTRLMEVPNGGQSDECGTAYCFQATEENHLSPYFSIKPAPIPEQGNMIAHGVYVVFFDLFYRLGLRGIEMVRMATAAFGILFLLAFYYFTRFLIGWRAAMWGMAFLAVSRYGIASGRHAIYDVAGMFMLSLVFITFWKGLKASSAWFVLSGLLCGLLLHGIFYSHLIVPAFLALFLLASLTFRKLEPKKACIAVLLFALGFWATFARMWRALHAPGYDFFAHAHQVAAKNASDTLSFAAYMAENFVNYFYTYTIKSDWSLSALLGASPEEPIQDLFTGILMFLGIMAAATAWKNRKMETSFLLAWFVAALCPAVITESAVPYRIGIQMPALFALVGLGADTFCRFPACRQKPWQRRLFVLLVCAACFGAARWAYRSYFVDYAQSYASQEMLGGQSIDIAREMKAYPVESEFVLSDSFKPLEIYIGALSQRSWRWSGANTMSMFPQGLHPGEEALLIVQPSVSVFDGIFKSLYPHANMALKADYSQGGLQRCREQFEPGDKENLYCSFQIPAQDIVAVWGGTLTLNSSAGRSVVENMGLNLPSLYQGPWPMDAEWDGALVVPAEGNYVLYASGLPDLVLDVGGIRWKPGETHSLGQGFVRFHAELGKIKGPGPLPQASLVGPQASISLEEPSSLRPATFSHGAQAYFYPARLKPALLNKKTGQSLPAEVIFSERGKPVLKRVEPTVFDRWARSMPEPVNGACLVVWKAKMRIPASGTYNFYSQEGLAEMTVWVDGRKCYPIEGSKPPCTGKDLHLSRGAHALKVWFKAPYCPLSGPTLMVQEPGKAVGELLPMAWLTPELATP